MKDKIKSVLNHPINFEAVLQYFLSVALSVYLIFPMINFVRRMNGGSYLFSLWRDYIFIIAGIFLFLMLIQCICTWRNLKLSGLIRNLRDNPAWIFLALLSIWMIISAFVTGLDHETVIGSEKSHTGLICSLVRIASILIFAAGTGALLLYVAFLLAVFIRGAKNRKSLTDMNVVSLCTAFAYLVSSFTGVSMFYTAPYLFIFLAFGYYRKPEPSVSQIAAQEAES